MAIDNPAAVPPAPTPGAVCTAAKVRRLARRVSQIYDEALVPFGLTIGQFGLLSSLGRRHPVNVGVLAERLGTEASTVSRLLRPLVAAGLVVVGSDPDDRRARAIRLTDSGAARRSAATAGWHAAQAQLATGLGEGRLAALRFLLDESYAHLGHRKDG